MYGKKMALITCIICYTDKRNIQVKEINRSVISKENALGYRYIEDNNEIEKSS